VPCRDTGAVAADTAFDYRQVEPAGRLRRYVESIWYAKGMSDFGSERIAPTGSTVLGIVLGDALIQTPGGGAGEPYEATEGFIIGPHDEPIINVPTGFTHCVGIVTTAIGARAALGFSPAPLRGRVVPATAWPAFVRVRGGILDAGRDGDPGAVGGIALANVETALAAGLDESEPALNRCEHVVGLLERNPATPIADIADILGISHGHLDREFRRVVGIGPRTLSRVLRLRRLIASIDVYGTVAWTDLAAELGWFDQAHLIRDFKRFTGVTPTQYVHAQSVGYRPAEAEPGFVPDLTRPTGV